MPREKNKIAFFITSLRAGGGTRVIVDLANWLAKEGYPVDVLTLRPTGHYVSQISPDVRVVHLPNKRVILALFPMISYLSKDPPTVLLATDELSHLIALGARLFTNAPVRIVLRMGNMFSILYKTYTGFRDNTVIPFLSRWLYPKADAIIAVSIGVKADVQKLFNIPPERISVIFSPKKIDEIALAARAPVEHPWLQDTSLPVLVASSRLRIQKDIPTLLTAFALLQKVVPSRLILLGDGQEKAALRALAQDLHIASSVDFVGYVENPFTYIGHSDVFVTTSIWEGLPNSLLEAAACGVPLVAVDCDSGPREVLAPDTDPLFRRSEGVEYAKYGVLVPVKGVKELSEALTKLLTDNTLRSNYARVALERASAFDASITMNQYLSVLLP